MVVPWSVLLSKNGTERRLSGLSGACLRRRTVDLIKRGKKATHSRITDAVVQDLRLSAGFHEAVGAEFREVLRQGGLAQAHRLGERTDRHLSGDRQPAKRQQPLLVRKHPQRDADLSALALQSGNVIEGNMMTYIRYC